MGTLTMMHSTIESAERLLDAIREKVHQGAYAQAQDRVVLLHRVLEGTTVPCCLECGLALTEEERDRYTSWCEYDAPMIELRFEE